MVQVVGFGEVHGCTRVVSYQLHGCNCSGERELHLAKAVLSAIVTLLPELEDRENRENECLE